MLPDACQVSGSEEGLCRVIKPRMCSRDIGEVVRRLRILGAVNSNIS